MIPASTSPEPAVASQGGAFSLIAARPSGAAITVSGPFSSTTAPESLGGGAGEIDFQFVASELAAHS